MVLFEENILFVNRDDDEDDEDDEDDITHPPILARSIGSNDWLIPIDRIRWAQYCAQVWNDCGPLNENANRIPVGENRQQFIELVLQPSEHWLW